MKHLSKEEVKSLNITNYLSIRDEITNGMLFFTSGNYPISKAIQKTTKSPWSHVGILFNVKDTDRIMILESVEDMGVRLVPFTEYINNYDGILVICKLNAEIDTKVLGASWDLILKKYDKSEFIRILERIIKGEGRPHHNSMYICSELVEEVFESIYKFQYDKRGFISPENIWEDNSIELLWRVK